MSRVHTEHDHAADYALQARYWLYRGRCAKADGDIISASFAAMSWQRKWDIAERHSDEAERLEIRHGSVFPGVP